MINSVGNSPLVAPRLFQIWTQGRTAFPVKPVFSMYAQFKHVVGVPSRDTASQVPVNKLWLLDNLIEGLVKLREKKGSGQTDAIHKVSADNIYPLIQKYRQDLSRAMLASRYQTSGLSAGSGTVIDLYA